jgi:glycosyltransferase involved in cell wall biosynthesis
VRRTGARVVHAHNVNPSLGWRALAAARGAGARIVLHLHNYRLVCAVGTCFNAHGHDCVRCHGRDTRPGVRLACRGNASEAVVYAAALAAWQRRLVGQVDALVVPSAFAVERLRALRAPIDGMPVHVVPQLQRTFAERSAAAAGEHALVAARLSAEKGVDVAVEACERAGLPLVVAGDGPDADAVRARAGDRVRFVGHVSAEEVAALRARAALAIVPSRCAEVMPLAAVEAMAAGVPVVASDRAALPSTCGGAALLVDPGDPAAIADAVEAAIGDEGLVAAGLARAAAFSWARTASEVDGVLRQVYIRP